jgi:hypothetical protein
MRRANTAKDKPETTMTHFLIASIAALFLATGTAHAQWYNHPYAPWRIQPGFRAPPVPDHPYIYANQA